MTTTLPTPRFELYFKLLNAGRTSNLGAFSHRALSIGTMALVGCGLKSLFVCSFVRFLCATCERSAVGVLVVLVAVVATQPATCSYSTDEGFQVSL